LKYYDGGWIDRGIRVSPKSPWISHLLFAEDCLVFIKADDRNAGRLNDILEIYGTDSGQRANKMNTSFLVVRTANLLLGRELEIHIVDFKGGLIRKILWPSYNCW
jgi:hypothetical protein